MRFSTYFICSIFINLYLIGIPKSAEQLNAFMVLSAVLCSAYFATRSLEFVVQKLAALPSKEKAKPKTRKPRRR